MAIQTRELFEQQLMERDPLVLSDGVRLDELVDIKRREVKNRVFNDPELHLRELERIWAQCWIPVCHETDLPKAGDFKRGYIGEDMVILTRAADNSINLLLNVCSHRSMEVCWSDEGNQSQFKCPYHGWVFDGTGKLLGAPFEQEMYGDWDKSQYGLKRATVAERHGVYFATFNPNPPSLEDYLTEFVGFFDLMFGKEEMVTTGVDSPDLGLGVIPANWKAVAEQNSGDGYHAVTLHHSLVEQGMVKGGDATGFSLDCYDTSSTGGHGVRCVEIYSSVFQLGERQEFPHGWFIAGSMFPSCGIGMSAMKLKDADGKDVPMWSASLTARAPLGPGEATRSNFNIGLVNKEVAEAAADGRVTIPNFFQEGGLFAGAAGNDDPESWASETRVSRGAVSRQETIKYNALIGETYPEDFPEGLGLVHRGFSKDDNQWHWWLAYYDWMTRD